MESHEVLKAAIDPTGVKRVAHELGLSSSLVYKWCAEDKKASGARNPLDRIAQLVACTEDTRPIAWLCQQAGGFFMQNPEVDLSGFDREFLEHTQKMLHNFSQLLQVVSQSMTDDQRVDAEEARRIRQEWETLKSYAETFVQACEAGHFDKPD